MLNMTSAYYQDQLVEKLQLMLATGELRVASWCRTHNIHTDHHQFAISFELITSGWITRVEYDSESEHFDFNRMLILLAEKLAKRANNDLRKELDQMNPKEKELAP